MSKAKIVILTGAGISAESGVATFRDPDGVWAKYDLQDVATPQGFARDPVKVQDFYNMRRRQMGSVEPNAAHAALAKLEQKFPGDVLVVTQNIDDLHERAGSRKLIHMHGELGHALCLSCGQSSTWADDIAAHSACPACGAKGQLRPDVVWFGENALPHGGGRRGADALRPIRGHRHQRECIPGSRFRGGGTRPEP